MHNAHLFHLFRQGSLSTGTAAAAEERTDVIKSSLCCTIFRDFGIGLKKEEGLRFPLLAVFMPGKKNLMSIKPPGTRQ